MGENGGKWGEMEENGGKSEIVINTSWKMYENVHQERKMEKSGVEVGGEMGEKWDTVRQLLHFSTPHFPHSSYRSPISLQGR